jgi:ABC-type Fe3+-hydroxamate transport system substrate-binding protein
MACDRAEPTARASDPSPRVVSLSPAVTSTLVEMGLAMSLRGRTPWCVAVAQVPVLGSMDDVDLERLVAEDPELIVIQRTVRGPPAELLHTAATHGWKVEQVDCDSLRDMRELGPRLASLMGREQAASALSARWDGVMRPPAGVRPGERVAMLLPGPEFRAFGAGSYLADLWHAWGGRTWPDMSGWPAVQLEDVVAAKPDRVIVVGGQAPEALVSALAPRGIPVESLPDAGLLRPGPELLGAVEAWRCRLESAP